MGKEESLFAVGGCANCHYGNSSKNYLKLTATKLSYSIPRYIPREFHILPQRYLHIYVYCSYIYYSKEIEQCRHSSIEESIMKMYACKMEYCLAIKKN